MFHLPPLYVLGCEANQAATALVSEAFSQVIEQNGFIKCKCVLFFCHSIQALPSMNYNLVAICISAVCAFYIPGQWPVPLKHCLSHGRCPVLGLTNRCVVFPFPQFTFHYTIFFPFFRSASVRLVLVLGNKTEVM